VFRRPHPAWQIPGPVRRTFLGSAPGLIVVKSLPSSGTNMAQITTGIRAVLRHPLVYETVQFLAGSKGFRDFWAKQLIRPFPGARILDIGCGPAEILHHLPHDVVYVGYDIGAEYIEHARSRYGNRATFHATAFDETELARHPPFDIAIVSGVLHHLDDDQARNLMALLRRAVPAGRVITGDIVVLPKQDFIMRQVIAWDRGRNARTPEGYQALARPFFSSITGQLVRRSVVVGWMMECS
jgi:SAM-dependent methyltransferase